MGRVVDEHIQASGPDFANYSYGYDDLGQPAFVERDGTLGYRRDEYGYSVDGYLTDEVRDSTGVPENIVYSYDAAGNRTGRMRSKGTWSESAVYGFGYGNRLETVAVDGVAGGLTWNGLGDVEESWDGTVFARYPHGSEMGIYGTGVSAEITRDAFGRAAVIEDGGPSPALQVWGNPGVELPLGGIDRNGQPYANVGMEGLLVAEIHGGMSTVGVLDARGGLALTGPGELMEMPGAFGGREATRSWRREHCERESRQAIQPTEPAPGAGPQRAGVRGGRRGLKGRA